MNNDFIKNSTKLNLDSNFNELSENKQSLYQDNSLNLASTKELNNIDTTTNCLALTVKENYHIVVVKNFFKKGFRVSWKIALSMFTINFLNMFL